MKFVNELCEMNVDFIHIKTDGTYSNHYVVQG
jgi:hypothetical protein